MALTGMQNHIEYNEFWKFMCYSIESAHSPTSINTVLDLPMFGTLK